MYTLKITIQSFQNIQNIQKYLKSIQHFLKIKNLNIKTNIKTNQKNKIYTVLRSPHVNKKSREQFNFNFFKQTIYISYSSLYILFNFLIIFKKILPTNTLIKVQVIKN